MSGSNNRSSVEGRRESGRREGNRSIPRNGGFSSTTRAIGRPSRLDRRKRPKRRPSFGERTLSEIPRDEIKELCFRKLEEGRKKPKKLPNRGKELRLSSGSVSYLAHALSAI